MSHCSICLKEKEEMTAVQHVNGQFYPFCSEHLPPLGRICALCGKEIQFGEEVSAMDLEGGKPTCIACWRLHYPPSPRPV